MGGLFLRSKLTHNISVPSKCSNMSGSTQLFTIESKLKFEKLSCGHDRRKEELTFDLKVALLCLCTKVLKHFELSRDRQAARCS